MKNITLSIFILALISCESTNLENDSEGIHPVAGKWQLTKIVSAWTGEEQAPDREQFYVFKSDGSFSKTSGAEKATGTFETEKHEETDFISLIFLTSPHLSESCSTGSEYLRIENEQLIVGGSAPCDGPFLYYQRLE